MIKSILSANDLIRLIKLFEFSLHLKSPFLKKNLKYGKLLQMIMIFVAKLLERIFNKIA